MSLTQNTKDKYSEFLSTSHYSSSISRMSLTLGTKRNFTLIELLIVIGIIGALTALILPSFNLDEVSVAGDVNQTVNAKEINIIQKAFLNFYDDVVPSNGELEQFSKYGLRSLIEQGSFEPWDANRKKGWRGPYLSPEGQLTVDVGIKSVDKEYKQEYKDSGGTAVPVVYNSYGKISGHHYRVMIPVDKDKPSTYLPSYLCLINPGANGIVDLTSLQANTDTGVVEAVGHQGDDDVIRLLPFD